MLSESGQDEPKRDKNGSDDDRLWQADFRAFEGLE
jgi:hypothetical protein